MNLPTTKAIDKYLREHFTSRNVDLISRVLEFGGTAHMEVQVTTVPDSGFDARPLRIPKFANTAPKWVDHPLGWPTDPCIDAVGFTGWDWVKKRSRWVGFDFDSVIGHAKGLSFEELDRVKEEVSKHPWIELRRSTSGGGLHIYVVFGEDGIPCENHSVHAYLATVVLDVLAKQLRFPLADKLDVGGHILWVSSPKATAENKGFELLSSQTEPFPASASPADWRDHSPAEKAKHRVQVVNLPRNVCSLDDQHRDHIEKLHEAGFTTTWVEDLGLLQTHTAGFQKLAEVDPSIRGFFKTISSGRDPGQPNCFAFPRPDGAWDVYRFGQGTQEHESWEQDGTDWTSCSFNKPLTIEAAAQCLDLTRGEKGYQATLGQIAALARMIGTTFDIGELDEGRQVEVKRTNRTELVIKMTAQDGDAENLKGWFPKPSARPPRFERVIMLAPGKRAREENCRFCLSEEGKSLGFASRIRDQFVDEAPGEVALTLLAHDIDPKSISDYMSQAKQNRYIIVNRPFAEEFPETDLWNRDAAKWAYEVADHDGEHPHYDLVLQHNGRALDNAVALNEWCAANGIHTGADYLLCFAASVFQFPFRQLPWLFFFGRQNCGKSSYYRMLQRLVTKGAAPIDKVFTRKTTFDGELAGVILGIVEEADLTGAHAKTAYEKIKQLTEADKIMVERKGWDGYLQRNTLHIIQTANHPVCCPLLEADDSRVVVLEVEPLSSPIGKLTMQSAWDKEAPYFIRTLLTYKVPEPTDECDRLFLPVLWTPEKGQVIEAVSKVEEVTLSRKPAAAPAQRLEPAVRMLASWNWLRKVTANGLLMALQCVGEEDEVPSSPNELGQALSHMDLSAFSVRRWKSGERRLISILNEKAA